MKQFKDDNFFKIYIIYTIYVIIIIRIIEKETMPFYIVTIFSLKYERHLSSHEYTFIRLKMIIFKFYCFIL